MVVEDDPGLRFLLERILRSAGYQVTAVPGPLEALDFVTHGGRQVELLVSDVSMPVMDGCALALRLAELIPNLRTLLISGLPNSEAVADAPQLDRVEFLQKPFTAHTLTRKVASVLTECP